MSQEGFDRLKSECINSGLCVECGACAVVCPTDAIELKQYPWGRNPELSGKCTDEHCTLCYEACAARDIPISKIEKRFFGRIRNKETVEKDVGVFQHVYTGHTTDPEIRGQAVSGGVITGLLIHALEKGMIDGAVLAGFDEEKPWNAKACVATSREEILHCAGSKYQPHPQLLGIREAYEKGLRNIAVTSTPCHAHAVRKLMMNDKFAQYGSIVKLLISNICAAHWSLHGTEWLIEKKLNLKLEDVAELTYRARPFPGNFRIGLKTGEVIDAPFVNSFLSQLPQFTPEECRMCLEKVGFSADIVVGDTWHHPVLCPSLLGTYSEEEVAKDERIAQARQGMTAVVVRSELGRQVIDSAEQAGALKLYPDTPADAEEFLSTIHSLGKPVCNGPVVEARKRRGLPTKNYC